jgi:putative component of membrane protein insertase Oxa1/YidC/SpoIIIJ protein YidD
MKKLILKFIDAYQRHGGGEQLLFVSCNLRPSCSHFGKFAIEKYGVIKGLCMLKKRMKKCTHMNRES